MPVDLRGSVEGGETGHIVEHAVRTANHGSRIGKRRPGEGEARRPIAKISVDLAGEREWRGRVQRREEDRLVAHSEVEGEAGRKAKFILHEKIEKIEGDIEL